MVTRLLIDIGCSRVRLGGRYQGRVLGNRATDRTRMARKEGLEELLKRLPAGGPAPV